MSPPGQAPPPQLHQDIVPRLTDFFDLLGKRQCELVLGSGRMKRPLYVGQRHEVLGLINLLS